MTVKRVAILSPGDMGHAVGRSLRDGGLEVISFLEGRSERTRGLAEAAGIADVASLEDLVEGADLILSIMVPSEAKALARDVGQAIRTVGSDIYYADCNAISPETTLDIEEIIAGDGGRFIDASIIGGPPKDGYRPRFYVSGETCGGDVGVGRDGDNRQADGGRGWEGVGNQDVLRRADEGNVGVARGGAFAGGVVGVVGGVGGGVGVEPVGGITRLCSRGFRGCRRGRGAG